MKIIKVTNKSLADICDEMLTNLIEDERKYDSNFREDFVVRDWYSTTLDNPNRVTFVAVEGEEIIGFIHGFIKDKAGTTVNNTVIVLDAMYVKEERRNQGVGTELINEFKNWSRSVNGKYIDLTALNNNFSAIELYKGQGFEPLKSYMRCTIE